MARLEISAQRANSAERNSIFTGIAGVFLGYRVQLEVVLYKENDS
jgi:hypothetical protein